ncbi:hypothetical protein HanXRQr2_Chr08g0357171 [Helianthus annuus]|uniref:Uncharacterized protein n=1 Tax=Helianthus annuus TaxID=4232 RepID=A0A9K3IHE0_HELAN|nr:hypothetical protein HanXRQr2_Chr08g0357171 [Helianthus annuus]KAJ0903080.1 hypothetical protein HanPSC8_Chr08g0344871 [Helianthus annuus]
MFQTIQRLPLGYYKVSMHLMTATIIEPSYSFRLHIRLFTTLSSKEKEEDFMAMKGCKLPQRSKKRAKMIQRTLLAMEVEDKCVITHVQDNFFRVHVSKKRGRHKGCVKHSSDDTDSGKKKKQKQPVIVFWWKTWRGRSHCQGLSEMK